MNATCVVVIRTTEAGLNTRNRMNTTIHSSPPSMADLVRAISEEAAQPREIAPTFVVMKVPRPHWIIRLLIFSAVILTSLLAMMLYGLTLHVQGLMSDIRAQEYRRANPLLSPLPSAERLLNPTAFAIDSAIRISEGGRLHTARAQALVTVGRHAEAIDTFATASQLNDAPLADADRVALSEALHAVGRSEEAQVILLGVDFSKLNADQRARGNDTLGRLAMGRWHLERERLTTPSAQKSVPHAE